MVAEIFGEVFMRDYKRGAQLFATIREDSIIGSAVIHDSRLIRLNSSGFDIIKRLVIGYAYVDGVGSMVITKRLDDGNIVIFQEEALVLEEQEET